jgi:hypothetical protein
LIKEILNYGKVQIIHASKILGILREKPDEFLRWRRDSMLKDLGIGTEEINKLDLEITKRISNREKARIEKYWKSARNGAENSDPNSRGKAVRSALR